MGGSSVLVGRSRHCDYPPEVRRLPAVGGFADPSIEAILALRPTLVVGARSPAGPSLEQALRAHGVETYFPATNSVAEIQAMIRSLGRKLGRGPAAARLLERMTADIDRVRRSVRGSPAVPSVMVIDQSPIVVAGPGSFADELVELAGGRNLIDRGGLYPRLGIERLLALEPEVIVDASRAGASPSPSDGAAEVSSLLGAPGWSELRAVQQGRVHLLRDSAALRPGPRIAQGLAELAQALHGR